VVVRVGAAAGVVPGYGAAAGACTTKGELVMGERDTHTHTQTHTHTEFTGDRSARGKCSTHG